MINAAKVTDEAIPYLAELTDLKSLDIADAKITKTGFKQLKKMLPKCSIACIGKKRK